MVGKDMAWSGPFGLCSRAPLCSEFSGGSLRRGDTGAWGGFMLNGMLLLRYASIRIQRLLAGVGRNPEQVGIIL